MSLATRETQIKTMTRYHFTPVGVSLTKTGSNKCGRGGGKGTSSPAGGNINGTATAENSVEAPQKIKNSYHMTQPPSPGNPPEKIGNIYSQRHIHPCVHCSVTHGGQDTDTTHVSSDRRCV